MNSLGFQITYLTLKGSGVADATVNFGPKLNVISGPSDTGKTFIGECIDYAFGSSTKPSDIPEAKGYESVVLGIKSLSAGTQYTIQRSLRGGGALVSTQGQTDRVLAEKHHPGSEDTISYFLLALCGLNDRRIRTNQKGKTRQISFRDIAQLIVISEQEIIRKHSPVRSGQHMDKTSEDSVFRLLLTGVDDASVIAIPDKTIVDAESKGKDEIIDLLIQESQSSLEQLAPGQDQATLAKQLLMIEENIKETLILVASERDAASGIEERRKIIWMKLRESQSRSAVLTELHERFNLLKAQYASDLRRLESIAEAGIRLDQMEQTRCPVCGAEAKYHVQQNPDHNVSLVTVAQSCVGEASHLQLLLSDLELTIIQNTQDLGRLAEEIRTKKLEMQAVESELANHFKPRLTDALGQLQSFRDLQIRVRQALDLYTRIEALNHLRTQGGKEETRSAKPKFVATAGTSVTEELALKIEALLRGWQFPGLQRVTFSDADQDILISGRKRSDHGKGVRAITHAAFTVGLMYYCLDKHMPHPGVVIVDSPLVVYREPDKDEAGFTRTLKDLAYTFLASQQNRGQVIILENEDPPNDLPGSPTIIRFTGAAHGRKGFIPDPAQGAPAADAKL